MITTLSTSVIMAFFMGMLFRDIALMILVMMARRAKKEQAKLANGQAASATKQDLEALAKKIMETTMVVELDRRDGMLYLYNKADGQFLAQAADMESLTEKLRGRFGTGKHYILEDDEVINT